MLSFARSSAVLSLVVAIGQAHAAGTVHSVEVTVLKDGKTINGPVRTMIGGAIVGPSKSSRVEPADQVEVTCKGNDPVSMKAVPRSTGAELTLTESPDVVNASVVVFYVEPQNLPASEPKCKPHVAAKQFQRTVSLELPTNNGPTATVTKDIGDGFSIILNRSSQATE